MNNQVQIVEFHPSHIDIMSLREQEKNCSMSLPDAKNRIITSAQNSVEAGTFIIDGRIIFCAGFHILWPGVAEGWMFSTTYVATKAMYTVRTIKRYIDQLADTFDLHRFHATSPSDPFHTRWMKSLGFRKEGTMRQFTHTKQDHDLFARIF